MVRASLVGLLVVSMAVPLQADHAERERRWRFIGIDPVLRGEIHQAIERGCRYLGRHQRDGHWTAPDEMRLRMPWGITALCALALRHAGGEEACDRSRRAVGWLTTSPRPAGGYECGLGAMLYALDPAHHGHLGAPVRVLAQQARTRTSGWWDYHGPSGSNASNLSASQFAALGVWAGQQAGARVPGHLWPRHLRSLVENQTKTGSWPYAPDEPPRDGYETATFMGHANLLLAAAGAGEALAADRALQRRVRTALRKGERALIRDGRRVLAAPLRAYPQIPDWPGTTPWWPYYRLYALQKACLFANLERLGRVSWYRDGARFLLRMQGTDGGWGYATERGPRQGGADVISTSLALLFLMRSSETYRPTRPGPVDAGQQPLR